MITQLITEQKHPQAVDDLQLTLRLKTKASEKSSVLGWFQFEQELKWGNILLLGSFHGLALVAFIVYPYAFDIRTLCTTLWCKFF